MPSQFKDYRDSFSCLSCRSTSRMDEFKCSGCGTFVCEHLVLVDSGMMICFCCHKDKGEEIKWPDWSYTMIEDRDL